MVNLAVAVFGVDHSSVFPDVWRVGLWTADGEVDATDYQRAEVPNDGIWQPVGNQVENVEIISLGLPETSWGAVTELRWFNGNVLVFTMPLDSPVEVESHTPVVIPVGGVTVG